MPIVVNPSFVWPPETDPVVSPDGRITAIVDPAHAGVLLRADFDDSVPDTPAKPEKVLRRNLWRGSKLSSNRSAIASTTDGSTAVQTATGLKVTTGPTPSGSYSLVYTNTPYRVQVEPGKTYSWRIPVKNHGPSPFPVSLLTWINGTSMGDTSASDSFTLEPGEQRDLVVENFIAKPDAKDIRFSFYYGASAAKPAEGSVVELLDGITLTESATAGPKFNGSSNASGTKRYRWVGAVGDSTSEEYTPATPFVPGHGATVARVRFERQDGTLVRSGNPAWAPGGYAHAYDHEATLGGGTLWRAVPIHFDGAEGTPSEYVGAVIPALSDGWAWLKPVADPNKAMLLKVEPPDLSYDGRVDTTSIAGAPRPAATWDVLEGFTTQLRSLVREKPVADQLMALLDEGPVLAQFPACAGLPDFYFIRGKVDLEHVHWDGYPWRRYQWDVISIDRPDTTDSPLRIPDLSYNTVERDWTTYDQLKSTVASYNKLLEP